MTKYHSFTFFVPFFYHDIYVLYICTISLHAPEHDFDHRFTAQVRIPGTDPIGCPIPPSITTVVVGYRQD